MTRLSRTVYPALIALLAVAGLASGAAAQDLDAIIAQNLEAKGGEAKLRSVESARVTGTLTMGGGQMQAPFVWEWKSPNKMRLEFTIQGMTAVQAFDGDTAWMIMPFTGSTEPQKMTGDQLDAIEEQADFTGPLVDPEEKGYTLELLGEEEVDGTPAYKIQVTQEDGDVSYLYLDKDYGLEIQSQARRTMQTGQEVEMTTAIGDYKEVDGLMIAHSYDIQVPGGPGGQNLTFDTVDLNVELPDDRFTMPESEAADEGAGAGEGEEGSGEGGGR